MTVVGTLLLIFVSIYSFVLSRSFQYLLHPSCSKSVHPSPWTPFRGPYPPRSGLTSRFHFSPPDNGRSYTILSAGTLGTSPSTRALESCRHGPPETREYDRRMRAPILTPPNSKSRLSLWKCIWYLNSGGTTLYVGIQSTRSRPGPLTGWGCRVGREPDD